MKKESPSSESTQIAVLNVMLQAVKDSQTAMAMDIREIKTNKYVTQNDMQLSLKALQDQSSKDRTDDMNLINSKLNIIQWIGAVMGGAVLVTLVGAILRGILKI